MRTMPRVTRSVATALCIGLVCASAAVAQSGGDLFIVDANVVDPAARQVRRGNLLIRDGVVAGAPQSAPAGFAGRTLDLDGKWVIPGLVDLHTHTFGNMTADRPVPSARRCRPSTATRCSLPSRRLGRTASRP